MISTDINSCLSPTHNEIELIIIQISILLINPELHFKSFKILLLKSFTVFFNNFGRFLDLLLGGHCIVSLSFSHLYGTHQATALRRSSKYFTVDVLRSEIVFLSSGILLS